MGAKRNNSERVKRNGVTYYIEDDCGKTCYDMDADDGVEVIEFGGDFKFVAIDKNNAKVFPDVKCIRIGEDVKSISIPNRCFPNVREVQSESPVYKSGSMLVIEKPNFSINILLNAFCLKPSETLDLSGIRVIKNGALKDCCAGTVINTENVISVSKQEFYGSNLPVKIFPECSGIQMLGTILVSIDKSKDYIIPEKTTAIASGIYFPSESKIEIRCPNEVFFRHNNWYLSAEVTLSDKGHATENDFNYMKNCNVFISSENPDYVEKDGIIYTKDMSVLMKCQQSNANTNIVIPDSVKRISDYAFYNCKHLERVEIPGTVEIVGKHAFSDCCNLKAVKMHEGIKKIFDGCFDNNMGSLKSLEIPGSIEQILNIFGERCVIEDIKLNIGTKRVSFSSSLYVTSLQNIDIPETVESFYSKGELRNVHHITLHTNKFPENLIEAVYPKNLPRVLKNYCRTNLQAVKDKSLTIIETPSRTLCIPKNITESKMLEINRMLNMNPADKLQVAFFKYCRETKQKLPVAFWEWMENPGNEDVKKYILRNRNRLVTELVEDEMDEEMSRFLQTGIFKSVMPDVYKVLQDSKSMNISKAYALEVINSSQNNRPQQTFGL